MLVLHKKVGDLQKKQKKNSENFKTLQTSSDTTFSFGTTKILLIINSTQYSNVRYSILCCRLFHYFYCIHLQ